MAEGSQATPTITERDPRAGRFRELFLPVGSAVFVSRSQRPAISSAIPWLVGSATTFSGGAHPLRITVQVPSVSLWTKVVVLGGGFVCPVGIGAVGTVGPVVGPLFEVGPEAYLSLAEVR